MTKKVAIIGGGVSGLSAAWHLLNCPDVEVDVFESSDRLGGHAHTIAVTPKDEKPIDVDVGFMVFNDSNYPNMTAWFKEMGIESEDTDMSLSVSLDEGKTVEWSSDGIAGLMANKLQILKPSFHRFVKDMIRFNKEAAKILMLTADDPRKQVTIKQYLREEGYSKEFATHYLLPMMAALWSASMGDVLNFPACQLIGFMCNHKMLQIFERPQWKTVAGRSRQYTEQILSLLGEKAHVSCPITSVRKVQTGDSPKYELFMAENSESMGLFDEVVFACHAPSAVDLLQHNSECDPELLKRLGEIQYEDNIVYVHSDPALMPKRKAAWASWNCMGKVNELKSHLSKNNPSGESFEGGESGFGRMLEEEKVELDGENGRMKAVYVTYYLNKLQNLKTGTDIFVTLNPHQRPDPKFVYKKQTMAHPQFTPQTCLARETIAKDFQGKDGLWFCGAWQGYGFHEDGCRGGFEVATAMTQVPLPWCVGKDSTEMVLAPPNFITPLSKHMEDSTLQKISNYLFTTLPVAVCKWMVLGFMKDAIKRGSLRLKMNDGSIITIGDGSQCGCDSEPVTVRVFDDNFFVKIATEYDLGLARSYMAGHYNIEPLSSDSAYDQIIRPSTLRNESNVVLGDPIGLTRLFHLFIGNRDDAKSFLPKRSCKIYANPLSNAAGLFVAKIGASLSFFRYRLTMDNSEKGGSLKNIHAHYDLSNDLFRTFLDKTTLMYSSAIYDGVKMPGTLGKLAFRDTLEEAEVRKLDTLLDRAQVQKGQTLLDIGFGWGGLSLHAAKKYGCRVTGITLSVEQKALAEERVRKEGLEDLINFEVIDYRTFARKKENRQKFDRVLSCEMIEAVGHDHLGEFFWAVEQVLSHDGVLVMEAITTPESRYETYLRTTDFINTIIFPGSLCPSLHALVDASYQWSTLTLEHIDNIGIHYAETLREWRRRFNASEETVRALGFDDVFMRVW
eukprot:CAMPEP_0194110658 /NCGR_PEP_ID=MMETSP0150-20130528/9850_1 /TAXON_ID=122233 /ORGANISM="Chaetoceros debilis, Strain MM31A-1" /LENGTH=954 /DNA_ID=CAMNT_0038799893 /DNA_START=5 /DNA_END=2866 /DNA_ORIENTATION=-